MTLFHYQLVEEEGERNIKHIFATAAPRPILPPHRSAARLKLLELHPKEVMHANIPYCSKSVGAVLIY